MNPGYLFLFKAILFGAITLAAAIFSIMLWKDTPWHANGYGALGAAIGAAYLSIGLLVLITGAAEAWSSWIIFKSGDVVAFSHQSRALFSFNILISVALILIVIVTLYISSGITAGYSPVTFLALALCLLFIPDLIAINSARGHLVLLVAIMALTIPTFFTTTYFSIRYASDSLQEIVRSQKRERFETAAIQQAMELKDENELPALLAGEKEEYDYYYRKALVVNLPDNFITDSNVILRSIEPERLLEDSLLESLLDKTSDFPQRLEQDTVLQQLLFKDFPDIGAKYFKYLPENDRSSEAFVFTFITGLTETHLVHSIYDLDGFDNEWLEYIDPSLRGDETFLLRLFSHNARQSQGIVFEQLIRYEERYVNATEKRLLPVAGLPCMRIRRLVQKVAPPELLSNHSFIEHLDQHVKGIGPCLKANVDWNGEPLISTGEQATTP